MPNLVAIQSFFLAVNEDAETLMNLLITVIMIAIWLAGSMIRTKGNKGGQSSSRKRSSSSSSQANERSPSRALALNTKTKRENIALRIADNRQIQSQTIISDIAGLNQNSVPQNKTEANRLARIEGLPASSILDENLLNAHENLTPIEDEQEAILDTIPNQWDSDDIARAILYQEILGSPVGMRNSNR